MKADETERHEMQETVSYVGPKQNWKTPSYKFSGHASSLLKSKSGPETRFQQYLFTSESRNITIMKLKADLEHLKIILSNWCLTTKISEQNLPLQPVPGL